MRIQEDFEIHDKLNPTLFDDAGLLKPEVREKLISIVTLFEQELDFPIDIVDIHLVGSNASYNYTENSDIDLHIIADFSNLNVPENFLQLFYDTKKSEFNKEYNITIKNIPVELYVENVNSNTVSNGIYSVCDNEWVKQPKSIKSITKHNIDKELNQWRDKINNTLQTGDSIQVKNILSTLYLIRHNSIAIDGEYGKGNTLFKAIRDLGLISKLKDHLKELQSQELSLESLNNGQIIQRL